MLPLPPDIVDKTRQLLAHLLHLPGSPLPRSGVLGLSRARLCGDASVVVGAHFFAERTRPKWEVDCAILRGALKHRPSLHLGGRLEHDRCWVGLPMPLYLKWVVGEEARYSESQRALAAISAEAMAKRRTRKGMVETTICAE